MSELESHRGKERNAKRTREVILNAAEAVFAEHGFDGARLDAIAKVSGYNKSLIGQYFGGKLGIYTEVLKRADRDLNALFEGMFSPRPAGETIASTMEELRTFIFSMVQTIFEFLVNHPRFLRVLTWEMAEGWQTYKQIASQFMTGEGEQIEQLFTEARRKGLLRSDFPVTIQLSLIFQTCQSYLSFLPMYQVAFPGEDISSDISLARARERITAWVVAAMVVDLPDSEKAEPQAGGEA
jgi:AcrR family transcriptional regulator